MNFNASPSTTVYSMPQFRVNEVVVLIDPVTNMKVHGVILSEWDFRHGSVAPSILRGEFSLAWYVVEIRGYMSEVSNYANLGKERCVTPPQQSFPILSGLTNSSLRKENALAEEIALKVNAVKEIQMYGPRKHFQKDSKVTASSHIIVKELESNMPSNHGTNSSDENESRNEWDKSSILKDPPKHASRRTISHALGLSSNSHNVVYSKRELRRFLRVVVMPESSLVRVGDQHRLLLHDKYERIRIILQHRFFHMMEGALRRAVSVWKSKMEALQLRQRQFAATRIQSVVRMWLCRNIISGRVAAVDAEQFRLWQELRLKLNVSEGRGGRGIKSSYTADQWHHFSTKTHINKYYSIVRRVLRKCVGKLDRRRLELLAVAVGVWRRFSSAVYADSIRHGHWDTTVDVDGEVDVSPLSVVGPRAEAVLRRLRRAVEDGRTLAGHGVSLDDSEYDNVASLPLALRRDTGDDEKFAAPPSNPSAGMALPPLPTFPATKGTDGSPCVAAKDRPKFNSYRKLMSGPIDSSCWIIPNMLLMGAVPSGMGHTKGWTSDRTQTSAKDAISLLTLAGIGRFVSLMTEKEEQQVESVSMTESVATRLQPMAVAAKKALMHEIFNLKCVRDTDQTKLDALPPVDPADPARDQGLKERRKRKAKIAYASTALDKAVAEMSLFPSSVEWSRYALEPDTALSRHELLPVIWAIESLLAKGERVYIYSRDGFDRAPLVCGCILGRLYGLSHTETLFRLQVHLNCSPNQIGVDTPVACPQTVSHRKLLEQILKDGNRIFDSISLRSQVDPQTHVLKIDSRIIPVHPHVGKSHRNEEDSTPSVDYRLQRGVHLKHDVLSEQRLTSPLKLGRGHAIPVHYSGGSLCADFYKNSDYLIVTHTQAAIEPTLPLIRRTNGKL